MQIGIIGFGNFGTALAQHLSYKHQSIIAWTRDEEVIKEATSKRRNPLYLPNLKLNQNIEVSNNADAINSCKTIVLAIPSKVLSQVLVNFKPEEDTLIISAIKGIDQDSCRTPLETASSVYGPSMRYGVISGPGFAKDLAIKKPASLVSASKDLASAKQIAEMFSHDNMRLYTSTDTIGVELGGIIKNVIAIAAGIADGLNLGDSARAGIITRGLAEMTRLAVALGANKETLRGLSGLGDLVLTATCDASRNRTVGVELGKGKKLEDIVSDLGSVAEGVTTTPLVLKLAESKNVEMPISQQVQRVLSGESTAADMVDALLKRPLKEEF